MSASRYLTDDLVWAGWVGGERWVGVCSVGTRRGRGGGGGVRLGEVIRED